MLQSVVWIRKAALVVIVQGVATIFSEFMNRYPLEFLSALFSTSHVETLEGI